MRALEPKHYTILAAFIGSLAVQIGGLQHGWHDALSPIFVSGVMLQISTLIGALYAGAPGATGAMTDKRNPDQLPVAVGISPIKDPSRLQSFIFWALLAGMLTAGACASRVYQPGETNLSPQAQRAQQAGTVAQRLGEFQNLVIARQQAGAIPTESARMIVTWTVASLKALKNAPESWASAALSGWMEVRPVLLRAGSELASWVTVIEELIKGGM